MDRMACVELPAFPLQLLLQRRPDWAGHPVAVVDRDKPQGTVLWVNEHARACRIRTGMRYGAGLSLARTLHAGEVPPADVDRGVAAIAARLRRFSPDVEPCRDEPGVFWLNASGLSHLHASPRRWADAVVDAIRACGLRAAIAVGFTRFGTYAVARIVTTAATVTPSASAGTGGLVTGGRAVAVVRNLACERDLAGQAPLDRLGIDPALRDSLQKLGVRTVRAFLQLPAAGIRRRFGLDALRLHQRAAGDLQTPLQPLRVADPLVARHDLDDPETDLTRLLFAVKRLLNRLLATIGARREMLAALTLHLRLDGAGAHTEQIRPAAPTLDAAQLLNLVRLRLAALALAAGVTELRVTARAVRTGAAQPGLFAAARSRRDLTAANRALARVRAEFGDAAVVRARLVEAHLPEARFTWEPLEALPRPAPAPRPVAGELACRPMVRRIHAHPRPLPPGLRLAPPAWPDRGASVGVDDARPAAGAPESCRGVETLFEKTSPAGCVRDFAGPYLVSGGWWRSAVHREYYFARMRGGDLLWIYYDRPRRRWCWQGRVE